jgi:hypothetical protein
MEREMKPDEKQLLLELVNLGFPRDELVTEVAIRLKINVKRAMYLLDKWTDKSWWEYGVTSRSGWLTKEGQEVAKRLNDVTQT